MSRHTARSIRTRIRAEITEEIKTVARRHLAAEGANLSLRAVARDLGMVSSAVYRYFASRDELLTALIIDAYDALGEAAERADAQVADPDLVLERWLAVTGALRCWALAHASEYALLYGSPVPGYSAPQDTVAPATRPVVVLGQVLAHARAIGRLTADAGPEPALTQPLRAEVRRVADLVAPTVTETDMARGLVAWTELFGALSFEIFGRLDNTIDARDAWFEYQMRTMASFIGLR